MKYNKNKPEAKPTVITHQGGTGFQQSPEIALLGVLATGIDKTFYEGSDDREKRLVELVNQVAARDKYFAAQCIVYARTVLGQRTATHRAAVALARVIAGEEWAKRFFSKWNKAKKEGGIIFRLDDVLEIAACYMHLNKHKTKKLADGVTPAPARFSNSMSKGFASAIAESDRFEIARYKGGGKIISLVDIVNLVRPIPTEKSAAALAELMTGKLKQEGTSEAMNSAAGREVATLVASGEITADEGESLLQDKKAANFDQLLTDGIGYLQLLRNLRNIAKADATLIDKAGKLLTNQAKIVGSKVYPHQIDLALEVLHAETPGLLGRKMVDYLDEAYELSTANVHELGIDEHTAVLIDTSGSMHSTSYGGRPVMIGPSQSINAKPIDKAALIGATLAKGVKADVYQFGDRAEGIPYNHRDSVNSIKKLFLSQEGRVGHGTYIEKFWELVNKLGRGYKRVFIISDMQIADSMTTRGSEFKSFVAKFGQPYIYAIDLCGYGNQPLKSGDRYFNLAGYSAQIYETAKRYEQDPQALINEVKAIKI